MSDLAQSVRHRPIASPNWQGFAALYWREASRWLRSWFESLAAPAMQAALLLAAFYLALGGSPLSTEGQAALAYLGPGLVVMLLFSQSFFGPAVSLVYTKYEGSIVDTLMAPISPGEFLAGYVLAGMTAGTLVGMVVLALVLLILPIQVVQPLLLIAFGLAAALLAGCGGLLVGIWSGNWDGFSAVYTFFLTPLLFLSGVFAPIDGLPELVQGMLRILPMYHLLTGFRAGLGQAEMADVPLSAAVVGLYIVVLGLLGWWLLKRGWRLRD